MIKGLAIVKIKLNTYFLISTNSFGIIFHLN